MAVTMKTLKALLEPEEPDYEAGKKLGKAALPLLKKLASQKDTMLASKAVCLAGMIGGEESLPTIEQASRHTDITIRVAAAYAVQHLKKGLADKVLTRLLKDKDIGVQKLAIRSAAKSGSAQLRENILQLSRSKSSPFIRNEAKSALKKVR
ncbi:MAG: HEAT repeat domain-containing protein [Nitrospirales bacterium]